MKKSEYSVIAPRKKEEFEAFIQAISEGQVEHWINIAEALGVDYDTITAWKRHPRAREAIRKGLEKALDQMKAVGAKDWKMWREVAKLLGVADKQNIDVTSRGEKLQAVNISNFKNLTDEQLQRIAGGKDQNQSASEE